MPNSLNMEHMSEVDASRVIASYKEFPSPRGEEIMKKITSNAARGLYGSTMMQKAGPYQHDQHAVVRATDAIDDDIEMYILELERLTKTRKRLGILLTYLPRVVTSHSSHIDGAVNAMLLACEKMGSDDLQEVYEQYNVSKASLRHVSSHLRTTCKELSDCVKELRIKEYESLGNDAKSLNERGSIQMELHDLFEREEESMIEFRKGHEKYMKIKRDMEGQLLILREASTLLSGNSAVYRRVGSCFVERDRREERVRVDDSMQSIKNTLKQAVDNFEAEKTCLLERIKKMKVRCTDDTQ